EKLISTPAPVNHQQVDELIDVHEDKTTVLQRSKEEEVWYIKKLCVVKERKKRLAMALDYPFGQQATTTPAPPKTISRSVNRDFIAPPEFLEDVSGEPKMRSINELMTLKVSVELSIDGGSITSAPAIMTMPSHHFLKLLGFNNHDLPTVEAATGHIMGHMIQCT
ncbi:hypothetical protein Tco_0390473, partial [Tanacetum coccineum]